MVAEMNITIDGKVIEAKEGQNILEAALEGEFSSPISAAIRIWRQKADAGCAPWKLQEWKMPCLPVKQKSERAWRLQ